jgi:DDE superfamily endonuclease
LPRSKNSLLIKIIALDETAIYASLKGAYGRCSLGKRCAYKTTDNKIFKKYSLLIAINTHGIVGWKLYEEGAVNSERLTAFIAEHITPKYSDNVVIMDNAGFHKTHYVKQEIQKKNQFIYTIPILSTLKSYRELFQSVKVLYKERIAYIIF